MGSQGVICDKTVRTTISDRTALGRLEHINLQFDSPAPNRLIGTVRFRPIDVRRHSERDRTGWD
jgi:hypothetical protein